MTVEPARLIQLLVYAALLASGQLLFKHVSLKASTIRDAASATQLFMQPAFWLALVLYGLATILWIYLLQRMSLSVAYAFVAIVFALVPFGAWWFFGERITWSHGVGTALIMAGVIVIGVAAS